MMPVVHYAIWAVVCWSFGEMVKKKDKKKQRIRVRCCPEDDCCQYPEACCEWLGLGSASQADLALLTW